MINIQESAKAEYIKDSVAKILTIEDVDNSICKISNNQLQFENFKLTESLCSQDNLKFGLCEAAHCEFKFTENGFDDITKINLITATPTEYGQAINIQPGGRYAIYITNDKGWTSNLENNCFQNFPKKYTCASFELKILDVNTLPQNLYIQLCYDDKDGNYHETPRIFNPNDYVDNYKEISLIYEDVARVYRIEILPGSDPGDILDARVQIKNQMISVNDVEALLPIPFIVTDWSTICLSENFKDKKIKAEIKLRDYADFFPDSAIGMVNWYNGTTDPAKTIAKTETNGLDINFGLNAVVNVNVKDLSEKDLLGNTRAACISYKAKFTSISGASPVYFLPYAHIKYQNSESYSWKSDNASWKYYEVSNMSDWTEIRVYIDYKTWDVKELIDLYFRFVDANKDNYSSGTVTFTVEVKEIVVSFLDSVTEDPLAFAPNRCYIYNQNLEQFYIENAFTSKIPLGFFNVKEVQTQYIHNICEKTITAYDDLLKLEGNAMDWYTSYMFGVDTDSWSSNGFEYARQIFSSYFNFVIGLGLDSKDNYRETQIAHYDYWDDLKPYHLADIYKSWESTSPVHKIRYCEVSVSDPDPSKLYMVSFTNTNNESDYHEIHILPEEYFTEVDALGRGVATNGSILIKVYRNGTTEGYCVNKNDYFMIPEDCTSFDVLTPCQTVLDDNTGFLRLLDDLTIYEVNKAPKLVNGHIRLVYYNYGTKELFDADSSITGRDVIHSLLEPCGCFFRLSRIKGTPEFIYPTKSGLYPSNTLYPADDLYPRAGTDGLFSLGRYISFICEDFEVKNYGRIQILKKANTNKSESVCEWEYIGNQDEINTYIFDDNIFYCADGMMYDYDAMPEVSEMLENMFINIANLGYTPNDTNALGMPWLECGDRIGLLTFDGGVESFVFRRTLKGIQNLKDIYESRGDEYTEAIDNYGYKIWEA